MKQMMRLLLCVVLLGMTGAMLAQTSGKASKDARKEAKKMEKDGWKPLPGGLPIARQYDAMYRLRAEQGLNMGPKYVFGRSQPVAQTLDVASMQANLTARVNLASNICTELTSLARLNMQNQQLSQQQAESVIKAVQQSAALVEQKLGRTITVIELYREKKKEGVEVMLLLAYDMEQGMRDGQDAVTPQLREAGYSPEILRAQ